MHNQVFDNEIHPLHNHIGKKYSMIASVVKSVARDRAISGKYGFEVMSKNLTSNKNENLIKLTDIFTNDYEYHIRKYFRKKYVDVELDDNSLYSDMGDILGQLSRLLIICVELVDEKYITVADKEIAKIDFYDHRVKSIYDQHTYLKLESYIHRLRNAVVHGHISTLIHEYWMKTELTFWDELDKIVHTEFRFTSKQLNEIIDIIIEKVCLKYLKDHWKDIEKYMKDGSTSFSPDISDS